MRRFVFCILAVVCWVMAIAQSTMDLRGEWQFHQGDANLPVVFDDVITLPGSMLTNGKGDIVSTKTQWTGSLYDSSFYFNPYMEKYRVEGQMKFPFFLTPEKHYVGTAWYQKKVTIPKSWKNQRVVLFLERPHIETTVYVNGNEVGHRMSLSVPHVYDLTPYLVYGDENTIAIKVYNGIENVCVGQDSHSVTDQTQGNWNGIIGRMELQARPKSFIEHIRVYPDAANHKAIVRLYMNEEGKQRPTLFHLRAQLKNSPRQHIVEKQVKADELKYSKTQELANSFIEMSLDMTENCEQWSEFNPAYYELTAICAGDTVRTTFGMRDIKIEGRQFYLNEHPIWLRGTVENCCFPATGYPPTDVESWLRVLRKCKEYGLNHIRFHSYCPPQAAFEAADQVGIYLQPEGPSWPNHGVKLRRGMSIDQYLLDECKAMLDSYGNHPSFTMMAAGNEPAGDWVPYCRDWVKAMHEYDSTKVYCGASVGGGWAWDYGSEYHVKGGARGLEWERKAPSSDDDYFDGIAFPRNYKDVQPNQTPIIAHEQGQWCAFPDFKEISQYDDCVYKAKNFEIFRDLLRDNGMASQAERFLQASGKLQTLAYKYEMERNLRTPDYAGFQLLSLNDYSGQGTALVGPLNVFWREKGYVDAHEWREFCSPIVPLARFPKFVYTTNDTLRVPVEVYNASTGDLKNAKVTYQFTIDRSARRDACQSKNSQFTIDNSQFTSSNNQHLLLQRDIPVGKNNEVGEVVVALNAFKAPCKHTLTVTISTDELTTQNRWDFWVYPDSQFTARPAGTLARARIHNSPLGPQGRLPEQELTSPTTHHPSPTTQPYITDSLDTKALAVLEKGGDVLITAAGKVRYGNDVRHTFLPVFWNTSWFKMRPPHTTGAYIQSDHPVFSDFPTDDWQDLQWWELTNRAQVMNLSEFPADYQPIVQPIDTWHVSRKLGMLIEARVLNGRLLMTTMDIVSHLDTRPVARQLRQSILSYMQSQNFQPQITLQPEVITHLFERTAPPVNMFTNESPDELKPKIN